MNAPALALPNTLPVKGQPMPVAALAPVASAPAAGLALTKANCVAQTTLLLRAACQHGQLDDAAAAARIALPLAQAHSPHQALLQVLAQAQAGLMQAPDENRLYLLRGPDGVPRHLLRLRDNGYISSRPLRPDAAAQPGSTSVDARRWALVHGQLVLSNSAGQTSARFALCGQQHADTGHPAADATDANHAGSASPATGAAQRGLRLYLGQTASAQDGGGPPLVLQEVLCTYTRLSMLDSELVDPFFGLYDIDAMVPASLPDRAALVLAAPHAGAASLVAALNRCPGVLLDGELLHPEGVAAGAGVPLPPVADALLQARNKDPAWFARMMLSRSHDALGRNLHGVPVRGFTLAPQHSRAALDWALAEPGLRIVHLVRSNLLAVFADILADQPGNPSGNPPAGRQFEAERFQRFVDMQQRYLAALRERLVQRQADTVEIDSSHLNPALLGELLGFLTDLPADPLPTPLEAARLRVSSSSSVLARFDNPHEVLACLDRLGHPDWAGAESQLDEMP